jgi:hypothetical protein
MTTRCDTVFSLFLFLNAAVAHSVLAPVRAPTTSHVDATCAPHCMCLLTWCTHAELSTLIIALYNKQFFFLCSQLSACVAVSID